MKIVLSLIALSLIPTLASAGSSAHSPNAINCYKDSPSLSDAYPCGGHQKVYLDLAKGHFALWPQKTDERYFDDYIKAAYIKTDIRKDASGKLKVISEIAGQVGVMEDGGNGAYCPGEESSNNLIRPSTIVDGKLSPEKMRELAYERAVNECKSQGGALAMDGNNVRILSEENKSFRHVRKIFPTTCLSSSVIVECDLSAHSAQIVEIYKSFRNDYPQNPLASDPRFDILK